MVSTYEIKTFQYCLKIQFLHEFDIYRNIRVNTSVMLKYRLSCFRNDKFIFIL